MNRPATAFFILACFIYCCSSPRKYNPIEGEWEVDSQVNRNNKVKEIIRIDDKYFQQFITGTDGSGHDGASLTQVYTLGHDTLQTFDINHDLKKVYAWNCFFVMEKGGDKLKLKTLDGEIVLLNRVHSDFVKVDTTLDRKLAN